MVPFFCGANTQKRRLIGHAVALIVRRRAAEAGFAPAGYSGHSLRAGFATSAALAGIDATLLARQTGHKSQQSLATYVRAVSFRVEEKWSGREHSQTGPSMSHLKWLCTLSNNHPVSLISVKESRSQNAQNFGMVDAFRPLVWRERATYVRR